MFGIGFWELAFILLLGLVVLGPEKLPRAIRTVGYYWRKMRTLAISAQQQIERELDAEEMRRYLAEDAAKPKPKPSDSKHEAAGEDSDAAPPSADEASVATSQERSEKPVDSSADRP